MTPHQELKERYDELQAQGPAPQPAQGELENIEQYRLQMAGISTAAFGYWKEGDDIHPDYDTVALRDVAKLYAKYDELFKLRQGAKEVQPQAYYEEQPDGSSTV